MSKLKGNSIDEREKKPGAALRWPTLGMKKVDLRQQCGATRGRENRLQAGLKSWGGKRKKRCWLRCAIRDYRLTKERWTTWWWEQWGGELLFVCEETRMEKMKNESLRGTKQVSCLVGREKRSLTKSFRLFRGINQAGSGRREVQRRFMNGGKKDIMSAVAIEEKNGSCWLAVTTAGRTSSFLAGGAI